MEIVEVKAKYLEAKQAIESRQKRQVELTQKLDAMRENLPVLQRHISDVRTERAKIFDAMVLGESSKDDLKRCDKALEQAEREYSEAQEIYDALVRGVKNCESELPKLHTQVDSLRHQVWKTLFEQKTASIPESIKTAVKELICIGLNCSMGRDFILPKIFLLPDSTEIQSIYKRIALELNIE